MSTVLETLFNNPADSDLQIQLHSGEIIYVHRLILKTCSPMLGAMFSGAWSDSAGKLQFQNSDAAVKVVIHSMYAGDVKSAKPHKTIKFAMYLQMDDLVKRLIHSNILHVSEKLRIKLGMFVDEYDHNLYELCAKHMFWAVGPQRFVNMDTLHMIVEQIGRRELDWILGNVDDGTACVLSILYGHRHQDCELAINAINNIDMRSGVIKRCMKYAFKYPNFPSEYKTMIVETFAKHPRMVYTCGCTGRALNECCGCGYKYCDKCTLGACQSRMRCLNNNRYMCPICQFPVKPCDDICSKCCEHEIRNRIIAYCNTCDMLSHRPNIHGYGKCSTQDVDGTMLKFREKTTNEVHELRMGIDYLVLEAANRMCAEAVGANIGDAENQRQGLAMVHRPFLGAHL